MTALEAHASVVCLEVMLLVLVEVMVCLLTL